MNKIYLHSTFLGFLLWAITLSTYAQTYESDKTLRDIFFTSDMEGYLVGVEGKCYQTADGGKSWEAMALPTEKSLLSCYFKENTGAIVGDGLEIFYTKNNGKKWKQANCNNCTETNAYLIDIDFVNERTGFAAGSEGVLLRTDNSGKDWYPVESSSFDVFYDVDFIDNGQIGFLCGAKGKLFKTTNGGESWQVYTSGIKGRFRSMKMLDLLRGYAVDDQGFFYQTKDGGESWSSTPLPGFPLEVRRCKFINQRYGLVVGNFNYVLLTEDGGRTWEQIALDIESDDKLTFYNIHLHNNKIYIVGDAGYLFRSDDVGRTWTDISFDIDLSNNAQ